MVFVRGFLARRTPLSRTSASPRSTRRLPLALILGTATAWLVVVKLFEFDWLPDWGEVLGVLGLGVALVLGFALAGSLPLLRAKPARALREL